MIYLDPLIFAALLSVSFVICFALVLARPRFAHSSRCRGDVSAVQAAHVRPTPRIGGVGIIAAALIALLILVPDPKKSFFAAFACTLMPVFAVGLAEDLSGRISAGMRLLAAAASAMLAIILLRIWIPPLGLPGIDLLMVFTPFAILLTVLFATGICHAMNLIDGVNGLAATTGLMIASGIAIVAIRADATGIATVAAALVPALIGFLLLNWPLGRIFLGDAGAYTLGHLLVWLAIALCWKNPDVSPVALALMFFWPVADTFLAIARRRSAGKAVGAPDRLHFHQFVMRALILLSHCSMHKVTANSLTALILVPLVAIPIVTAVYFWDRPYAAFLAWMLYGAMFTGAYLAGVRFFRTGRWRAVARRLPDTPRALRRKLHEQV